MKKSMLKAELSKDMRTFPTVHSSDCGNNEAPINYQQLLLVFFPLPSSLISVIMNNYPFGSNSSKSFNAYPRGDFDIESDNIKRTRRFSLYEQHYRMLRNYRKLDEGSSNYYLYAKLKNLVVVFGYSIYTSNSCKKVDNEDSWFLEP
ncbi:hypothetical protein CXB51_001259 [Gossypium anomalum]|uniref:Uncharacterized protein n=1 Tax=Gossypium anomalum TaxID=47600 RepID=A0A8J6DD75_9ROSI|nr:hypothetical protein CXB51_001259 [Gossypium anomalum]